MQPMALTLVRESDASLDAVSPQSSVRPWTMSGTATILRATELLLAAQFDRAHVAACWSPGRPCCKADVSGEKGVVGVCGVSPA